MPTYEYECDNCGHTFEEFQAMSDKPLRKCPKCAKMKLQRLIGAGAGIIFKGSGFYETDYKRKDQPKPAAEGGSSSSAKSERAPAKSESAPKSSSGGESKTAAKAS
jgi:putative FmdB family regulatory protein